MDIVRNNTKKPTRSKYSLLKESTGLKLVSNTGKNILLSLFALL
jgi:hypothetical protein